MDCDAIRSLIDLREMLLDLPPAFSPGALARRLGRAAIACSITELRLVPALAAARQPKSLPFPSRMK